MYFFLCVFPIIAGRSLHHYHHHHPLHTFIDHSSLAGLHCIFIHRVPFLSELNTLKNLHL
uniref:Uncharacterized protein n=1 Tax=Anopheles minimus TaxID=112268 RepID=A0A182WQB0_9DIPT